MPIAVEQTASGYEIAWKNTAAGVDQYSVWNTDSSGNYLTNVLNNVSGSSIALGSIETSFQQDLNGDGTIGLPKASNNIHLAATDELPDQSVGISSQDMIVGSGQTIELSSPYFGTITFSARTGTLRLDHSDS